MSPNKIILKPFCIVTNQNFVFNDVNNPRIRLAYIIADPGFYSLMTETILRCVLRFAGLWFDLSQQSNGSNTQSCVSHTNR